MGFVLALIIGTIWIMGNVEYEVVQGMILLAILAQLNFGGKS